VPLQKQPISLVFNQGLNLKADPYQIPLGQFAALENTTFTTTGRLSKRNGFKNITNLPNATQTTLTTLNQNLIATGSNLYAYSSDTNAWLNQGTVQPVSMSVQPLVRVSTSQSAPDAAVTSNGLTCLVYTDSGQVYYQVSDSNTGQQVVQRQALGANTYDGRAFLCGQYFMVTYLLNTSGNITLNYVAIPTNMPSSPKAAANIGSGLRVSNCGYDGVVANDVLYLGWATLANTMNLGAVTQFLVVASPAVIPSATARLVSLTADTSGSTANIWMSYWDDGSGNGYSTLYSHNLLQVLAPVQIITTTQINEITSTVNSTVLNVVYENANTYGTGPNSSTKTDYISTLTCTTAGVVSSPTIVLRSVGLASKSFLASNSQIYFLATYGETSQPSYFLVNTAGTIVMRLAYSNGGGYQASQILSNVTLLTSGNYVTPYLIKDFLTTINKNTNNASGTPVNAIYTQTGINLVTFGINTSGQYSSEIAGALHLTGGQVWEYDGVKPVELGFHVWPENQAATFTNSGGNITNQQYYYQFTYEWTDNQGNLHRSAPSIPLGVNVTSGSTNTVTLYVPTLRLTAKVSPNPVRIVGYRWSAAQQVYYQFTSVTSPTLNDPTVDLVTITDTLSDASILGNAILYTTGGVIENIAPPASVHSTLFNNRLWLVDAEDRNLLWYSKQVIEAVPVEMSDLLTIYVAPTTGAQGSTGPIQALAAMDDKLIIFKQDAIYYINGIGPDNTGANSGYSDPIFISSAVGCSNPSSIVLTPNGLMFQSDKGIWLLGRGLDTQYVGAPVEAYNSNTINSAQAIPATNQVRFVLSDNTTLVYDYFFQQWCTFNNIYAISSTLYQGYQTYLNSYGAVFQETPGTYLDGSQPVLMSFTTSWINVAGLQGYERLYQLLFLGTYLSPFKMNIGLAYDYNPSTTQQTQIVPDNYVAAWGGENVWGGGPAFGGPGNVFQARLFPQKQKCESFQVTMQEVYDSSYGVNSGAGLSLSGMNLVVGLKKGYRPNKAAQSFG